MALKLITFDATGTLLVLKESVGKQYAKVGSRHGLNADPDSLSKQFFSVFKSLLVEHPNFGEKSGIGWHEWWNKLVFRTFQNSVSDKSLVQPSVIEKISSDLIEAYKTKECWKLAEGAKDLLEKLRSKNVHIGVLSNYDPRLECILEDLNIRMYFHFIVTSYTAKCEKPDPAIFKTVEDMNIDVRKNEILHIGDNFYLDFVGAKNVGWNALLITDNLLKLSEDCLIDKEWTVKNIGEILPTLENKKLL